MAITSSTAFSSALVDTKDNLSSIIKFIKDNKAHTHDPFEKLKYNEVLNRLESAYSCLDSIVSEVEAKPVTPVSVVDETLITEEELTEVILPLLPAFRSNMTPITRYLKIKKPDTLSLKEYAERATKYKEDAVTSAAKILDLINHSRRLAEVEYKLAELKKGKRKEKES